MGIFLERLEDCSPEGSIINWVGTPISFANNFNASGNLGLDFIGTTNTNPLSDTNNYIQVLLQVDFAFFVTKNVCVKKCVLIRWYLNILLFVEKF